MPTAHCLSTERLFQAPPGRVWQAFADPDPLALWWGPDGFANVFDQCDFRVGGDWRFTMVGPDGQRYWNESRFVALAPQRRLVIEHLSPPRFTLTVTLSPEGGGTRLSSQQCFETAELCHALAPVCLPSNEQNLDRLGRLLAGQAP